MLRANKTGFVFLFSSILQGREIINVYFHHRVSFFLINANALKSCFCICLVCSSNLRCCDWRWHSRDSFVLFIPKVLNGFRVCINVLLSEKFHLS